MKAGASTFLIALSLLLSFDALAGEGGRGNGEHVRPEQAHKIQAAFERSKHELMRFVDDDRRHDRDHGDDHHHKHRHNHISH